MPKRSKPYVQVSAAEVQGEESWIRLRKYTWAERKELQARFRALNAEKKEKKLSDEEASDALVGNLEEVLIDRLMEWNWVDAEGMPLPIPKAVGDLGSLQDDEIQYLFDRIQEQVKYVLAEDENSKN